MTAAAGPRHGLVLGLSAHGFHRMHYVEWGDATSPRVLVCVHGLTRNARDFDVLAEALSDRHRVVCPDVVGRGRSDRLAEAEDYGYAQYMADMTALVARLAVERVDWLGTSMGGLLGLMLAAQPGTPVDRLILNDVGPLVPKAALERIAAYIGDDPHFADFAEAEAYLRRVHAPFGRLTDGQWRHLTEHSLRADPQGGYRLAYDPAIAAPLRQAEEIEDIDLWHLWDAVRGPVLALRGAESDLLTAETAAEMTRRGPGAELVEFTGCGHAPALMDDRQVRTIREWLQARDSERGSA